MAQGAGLAVEFLAGRGFHHALHSKYVGTYFVVISNASTIHCPTVLPSTTSAAVTMLSPGLEFGWVGFPTLSICCNCLIDVV